MKSNQLGSEEKALLVQQITLQIIHALKQKIQTKKQQPRITRRKPYIDDSQIIDSTVRVILKNKDSQVPKYSTNYQQRLDARDQMLIYNFQFILEINLKEIKNEKEQKIQQTKAFRQFCQQIRQYLVNMVQNILSISFNLLVEKKLSDNQCKDYASKNILLNLHSLLMEITQNSQMNKVVEQFNHFKEEISVYIDDTLKDIIKNIISYYPQSPPTGATPKMKSVLSPVDHICDEQLDLFCAQKIQLQKQESGDYTEFIMNVINKAIEVSGFSENSQDSTLFQKFVAFNQKLFWISNDEQVWNYLEQQNNITNYLQKSIQSKQAQTTSSSIFGWFCQSTSMRKIVEPIQTKKKKISVATFEQKQSKKEQEINKMKFNHDFMIGQKIPNGVKLFTEVQIQERKFKVSNSSVLRVLTKWASNLQEIFEKPKYYTLERLYPYKSMQNQNIYPYPQLNQQLYKNLLKQKKKVKYLQERLKEKNKIFQTMFFGNSQKGITKLMKRYTQTRVLASNLNQLLIQIMKQFVSELIKSLVNAGKLKNIQVNLVVFGIGDLMRSKVYCSQAMFIKLIKTLTILDNQNQFQASQNKQNNNSQLLKLVRIKNKLDSKDSNVLINYLFMGKIQCELQMSIQKMKGKQQSYNQFNHFLYQLIRGKFGILSECATIISQHDPILVSNVNLHSKNSKKKKKEKNIFKDILCQQLAIQQKQKDQNRLQSAVKQQILQQNQFQTIICSICGQFESYNKTFLKRKIQNLKKCDDCLIEQTKQNKNNIIENNKSQSQQENKNKQYKQGLTYQHLEKLLSNVLRDDINNILKKFFVLRLESIDDLQRLRNQKDSQLNLMMSINSRTKDLNYSIIGYIKDYEIYYTARLTKSLMKLIKFEKKIQHKDIQSPQINQKLFNDLIKSAFIYITPIQQEKQNLQECFKNTILSKFSNISKQLHNLHKILLKQKIQKRMHRDIKTNNQILFWKNQEQLNMIDSTLISKDPTKIRINHLRNIKLIYSKPDTLQSQFLPEWISYMSSLKMLSMPDNFISQIYPIKNCVNLQQINLSNNKIKNISQMKVCSQLITLDLSSNTIDDPTIISNFKELRKLSLSNNQIANIQFLKGCLNLTKLDLSKNRIISLKGIQNCIQLVYLNLSQNKIEQINLLVNLKLLIELLVRKNKLKQLKQTFLQQFTELGIMDLSQNNYKQLKIQESKSIKKLIIQNCSNLIKLQVNQNKLLHNLALQNNIMLKQLIIIKNPMLLILQISKQNIIQRMDFQQNTSLSTLDIVHLSKLIYLKITKNFYLKFLKISSINQLRTIIIEKNYQLTIDFSILQNLSELQFMQISDSYIDNFKASKLSKLESLKIINNTNLNNLQILNLKFLKTLTISQTAIKSLLIQNLPLLLQLVISSNNQLQKLDLNKLQKISDLQISYNCKLDLIQINHLSTVQKLKISGNKTQILHIDYLTKLTLFQTQKSNFSIFNIDTLNDLEELYIQESQITELKLQNKPNLKTIHILSNLKLTNLEIIKLPSLNQIKINNNDALKSIKMIKIPSLSGISLFGKYDSQMMFTMQDTNKKLIKIYIKQEKEEIFQKSLKKCLTKIKYQIIKIK